MVSVIVIGNGFSLKNKKLGSKIDEFDEVIRINDWKTKLFEEDAGTKTTIWGVYNPEKGIRNFINGYTELGLNDNEIKKVANQINEIWYISWKLENILDDWKKSGVVKQLNIYDKCKRHISVSYSKKIRRVIDIPTTGFILIYILSNMYDKIYLAGFDFAGEKEGETSKFHHYYGKKILKDIKNRDIHDPKIEYEYIKQLIKQNKVEYLTKHTKIENANFIGEYKLIGNCTSCNHSYSLYNWEQPICNYCEKK